MAFIHIALSEGPTADDVRQVEEKVGPRAAIEGLMVEAWGIDGDRLRHVTVWESEAHKDRYEAEQLLPAFQALGMAQQVAAKTEFVTCQAAGLFIR
jgi:hypothetical protein